MNTQTNRRIQLSLALAAFAVMAQACTVSVTSPDSAAKAAASELTQAPAQTVQVVTATPEPKPAEKIVVVTATPLPPAPTAPPPTQVVAPTEPPPAPTLAPTAAPAEAAPAAAASSTLARTCVNGDGEPLKLDNGVSFEALYYCMDGQYGSFNLMGELVNRGVDADEVEIRILFYNAKGVEITGDGSANVNLAELKLVRSGQTTPFLFHITNMDKSERFAKVGFHVSARKYTPKLDAGYLGYDQVEVRNFKWQRNPATDQITASGEVVNTGNVSFKSNELSGVFLAYDAQNHLMGFGFLDHSILDTPSGTALQPEQGVAFANKVLITNAGEHIVRIEARPQARLLQ